MHIVAKHFVSNEGLYLLKKYLTSNENSFKPTLSDYTLTQDIFSSARQ